MVRNYIFGWPAVIKYLSGMNWSKELGELGKNIEELGEIIFEVKNWVSFG